MSSEHDHDNETTESSEIADATIADAVALPTICPTCGTSRAGAAGSAHGCSTVPTMPSKSGAGIVYAPMATTDRCAECGQKSHRNLPRHERDLICLWQQFSAAEYPSDTKSDRFGVTTAFTKLDALHVELFSRWMDRGGFKTAPTRRGPRPKPVVTTSGTDPVANAIASDVNSDPESVKPRRMTKAERMAAALAAVPEQE